MERPLTYRTGEYFRVHAEDGAAVIQGWVSMGLAGGGGGVGFEEEWGLSWAPQVWPGQVEGLEGMLTVKRGGGLGWGVVKSANMGESHCMWELWETRLQGI